MADGARQQRGDMGDEAISQALLAFAAAPALWLRLGVGLGLDLACARGLVRPAANEYLYDMHALPRS